MEQESERRGEERKRKLQCLSQSFDPFGQRMLQLLVLYIT